MHTGQSTERKKLYFGGYTSSLNKFSKTGMSGYASLIKNRMQGDIVLGLMGRRMIMR